MGPSTRYHNISTSDFTARKIHCITHKYIVLATVTQVPDGTLCPFSNKGERSNKLDC